MTHRKRGVSPSLKEVLSKLHKKPVTYTPVQYSNSDILAAKKVLNRLLSLSDRNEVSYIKIVPTQLDEE